MREHDASELTLRIYAVCRDEMHAIMREPDYDPYKAKAISSVLDALTNVFEILLIITAKPNQLKGAIEYTTARFTEALSTETLPLAEMMAPILAGLEMAQLEQMFRSTEDTP